MVWSAQEEGVIRLWRESARHPGTFIAADWRNKRCVDGAVCIQMGDARGGRAIKCFKRAGDEEGSVRQWLDVFDGRKKRRRFGGSGPLHAVADIEATVHNPIWIN